MNKDITGRLEQKVREVSLQRSEIYHMAKSLSIPSDESFAMGVAAGRLYNAFFYQSRKILEHDPTRKEFEEFVDFLKMNKDTLAVPLR